MENNKTVEENNEVVDTTRKQSAMSVLKSWKTLIRNLDGSGLLSKEDYETEKKRYQKALKQYIGEDLL